MSDYGGTLRLSYYLNGTSYTYDLGTVKSINETFTKKVLTVPLTSLPAQRAFSVESGNSRSYSINFSRKSPGNPNDSVSDPTQWSNMHWYTALTAAVDRWQCLSDGFTLTYTPGSAGLSGYEDCENPFMPRFRPSANANSTSISGYVRSLERTYSTDCNEAITGTLTFAVGTMYVRPGLRVPVAGNVSTAGLMTESTYKSSFYLSITSSDQNITYYLLSDSNNINCVDSYTLVGGPSNPFESLTIDIPRKKLIAVAPNLVNDIRAGLNLITLNAVGKSTLIVSKCSLSNNTYTITAYSKAAVLRGMVLAAGKGGYMSADQWIKNILTHANYGFMQFIENETYLHTPFPSSLTAGAANILHFADGQNYWYILQVCAAYLGCKIFFTDNMAYVIDFSITDSLSSKYSSRPIPFYIYRATISPYTQTVTDTMYARVLGSVSLGSEGTDTVVNVQTVNCSNDPAVIQNNTEVTKASSASIAAFGEMDGNTIYVPELVQGSISTETTAGDGTVTTTVTDYAQADNLIAGIFKYKAEPQQSIAFTVKEMNKENNNIFWRPCFGSSACLTRIEDLIDEVTVDNTSYINGSTVQQKFLLSSFERQYPRGTTKYTFGVIENIDLSTSTQQTVSNLNNVK